MRSGKWISWCFAGACLALLAPGLVSFGGSFRNHSAGGAVWETSMGTTVERNYLLTARIRLLIPWLSFKNVGLARIRWTDGDDGIDAIELLVGSDPARAPRKINRWGYEAERWVGNTFKLTGVMTESDEDSIDRARKSISEENAKHNFKAIRAHLVNGLAESRVIHLASATDFTFHDLDKLLDMLSEEDSEARTLAIPPAAEPGFLFAVHALIRDSVEKYRRSQSIDLDEETRCVYVYNAKLYELERTSSKFKREIRIDGREYHDLIESRFRAKNLESGKRESFKIVYGVRKPISETPILIVYRPRWWFEAQLLLDENVTLARAEND